MFFDKAAQKRLDEAESAISYLRGERIYAESRIGALKERCDFLEKLIINNDDRLIMLVKHLGLEFAENKQPPIVLQKKST